MSSSRPFAHRSPSSLLVSHLPLLASLALLPGSALSQVPPRFQAATLQSTGDLRASVVAAPHTLLRIEHSSNLLHWNALHTLQAPASGSNEFTLSARSPIAPALRFLRAVSLDPTSTTITGDHLPTSAGDLIVHPLNHASLLLAWNGLALYIDPVGGPSPYASLPRAHLILITHQHGDHFNPATLDALRTPNTRIIAPAAVYASLSSALRELTIPLANGQSTNLLNLSIDAVPAYNGNHPRGVGNAYVLNLAGTRCFISGDTGPVPEIRALAHLDVAFLCMNVPFTMTVPEAADLLRSFQPRVVYPYHYRNQNGTFADFTQLRRELGTDLPIEIRLRAWY